MSPALSHVNKPQTIGIKSALHLFVNTPITHLQVTHSPSPVLQLSAYPLYHSDNHGAGDVLTFVLEELSAYTNLGTHSQRVLRSPRVLAPRSSQLVEVLPTLSPLPTSVL